MLANNVYICMQYNASIETLTYEAWVMIAWFNLHCPFGLPVYNAPTISASLFFLIMQMKVLSEMKHPNIVSYMDSFEGKLYV